jgi:hypothetical protein
MPKKQATTSQPKNQYIVKPAKAQLSSFAPANISLLKEDMGKSPGIEVLRAIGPAERADTFVVRMTADEHQQLKNKYGPNVIIEPDTIQKLFDFRTPTVVPEFFFQPKIRSQSEEALRITLRIVERGSNRPIDGATVYLFGSMNVAKGLSETDGKLSLEIVGESTETLQALYVSAQDSYWNLWLEPVLLLPDQDNTISLKRIAELFPEFPQRELVTWGQQAMGMGTLPASVTGHDVKVAIIDSGFYVDHEDLQAEDGADLTEEKTGWQVDSIGHGSHVAGTVCGLPNDLGVRGFAPDASIFACRVFPGGRLSYVIESLDLCIKNEVDVVNLSLGSPDKSDLLQDKIIEAKEKGIACIAAAGNSGDNVNYPAAYPEVLPVTAIGKVGTFPDDSYHARHMSDIRSGDYFSAKFTCHGPEIAERGVCAPGVAVVSCVATQPKAYAAWDGTSMACPHVVGLAALILQGRPEFRDSVRNANRVDKLFEIIRASAQDLGMPREYQGAGLPHVKKASLGTGEGHNLDQIGRLLKEALRLAKAEIGARD